MANRTTAVPTPEQHNALVLAFLKAPADFASAAAAVGVPPAVAKRAWETGWPAFGMPPIRTEVQQRLFDARLRGEDVEVDDRACKKPPRRSRRPTTAPPAEDSIEARIESEVSERVARALGLDIGVVRKSDDLAKAKDEVVRQRMQEARMVQLCRTNTTTSLVAVSNLLSSALSVATKLAAEIRAGESQLTPEQQLRFVSKTAYLAESGARAAKLAVEMERVLAGDPEEVLGAEEQLENISVDDAEHLVSTAVLALNRLKKRQEASG